MAGALIGEAALGVVASELLKSVILIYKRARAFKSRLEQLESNLKSLIPRCMEIEELYRRLGRYHEIEDFARLLNKGKGLVEKCTKLHPLNIYMRPKFSRDLQKLDNKIAHFCSVDLQLQNTSTMLRNSIVNDQISKKFDTLLSIGRSSMNENGYELRFSYSPQRPPSFTVGLEEPLRELKIKLLKDTETMYVLCAPGGCGKTTLAKILCHDLEIKGIFDKNIFFLTLSKVPDERALDYLKMTHMEVDSPKLVVLDDVWSGSEHLIDRFSTGIPDLKILVTSRFELRRYRSLYKLKLLNYEDSKKLFCESAFHPNYPMPDEDVLSKIIRSCNGFPIALTVVGKSLKGQPWVVWQKKVIQLSNGQTVLDTEEAVLKQLKQSVDDLETFPMECFLNLASFPEDVKIPAAALIDMSVELYKQCASPAAMVLDSSTQYDVDDLGNEDDDESVYGLDNICQLADRNLVNTMVTREDPGEAVSFCFDRVVTQHDLLRQLAIRECNEGRVEDRARLIIEIRRNNIPSEFWKFINQPSNASLVSITTDENFNSYWSDLQLPNAEVLILNVRTKRYTLPNFMKMMNKLKVLIITNYGFFPTEIDNLQILGSLSSLRRIRFERISFRGLDFNDVHLCSLMKLSFVMCDIGQALENCSQHLSEMLPSLREVDISYCNDLEDLPSGICDIVPLRKLSVTNCHKLSNLPDGLDGLSNLEVLRLHNCIELLELPDSICRLQKLRLLDISDCHSLVQLPEHFGRLPNLKTLIMNQCSSLLDLPFSVMDLENLRWVHCDGETADLWKLFESNLWNLKLIVQKKDFNLNWLHG
uniref:RPW8 domain-containing protein n=1 Tax=Kalanchoe fedtschenkoi TaxID=63787 RepID=A0A7N0T9P6_KALFE